MIEIDSPIDLLKPDMTANVSIRTAERDALVLPTRALHRDGFEQYVYVEVDGDRAIFAVLAGSAAADGGRSGGAAAVEKVDSPVADLRTRCLGVTEPEGGDVDITAEEVLVVVGRGIESEDNIEEAVELADALGGAVAASRPIIDQGWLPKTRQVGKSGLTVKPKVYLTLGVSGAPEHIEGMKDAGTIISINTDPQAPIFGTAHYGWVGDIFDILPELVDGLED